MERATILATPSTGGLRWFLEVWGLFHGLVFLLSFTLANAGSPEPNIPEGPEYEKYKMMYFYPERLFL